jgi:phosphate-selective porin OprO/OprP
VKAAAPAAPAPSVYDRIWAYAKPWNDPKNRWVQELSIVGREQFEYEHIESHEGDTDNFSNRRSRIGLKTKVLETVTLHSEVDLNLEGDGETYSRLTDSYIRWSPDKRMNLTLGKQGVKFTLDGGISSTQLVTMDRSNIANNFWFPDEYLTGVSVGGEWNKVSYTGGWYSGGHYNSEFGNLDGGSVVLLSGGYDLASTLGLDKAAARLDFVWQDPNSDTNGTRPEDEVLSFNFQGEKGRWGFSSDIDWSNGSGSQPDLYGGQLLGSMMFCDTWQLALRYTGIGSNGDNAVRLARYDNKVVVGRGDDYQEVYFGLNKYFYGHKLKWQTGISFDHMADGAKDGGHYSGVLFLSGMRVAW